MAEAVVIRTEVIVRQHQRFGSHASRERWITVMTEELGEIRGYLNEDVEGRPVDMSSRQELVQLTAILSFERSMTGAGATTARKRLVMADIDGIAFEEWTRTCESLPTFGVFPSGGQGELPVTTRSVRSAAAPIYASMWSRVFAHEVGHVLQLGLADGTTCTGRLERVEDGRAVVIVDGQRSRGQS